MEVGGTTFELVSYVTKYDLINILTLNILYDIVKRSFMNSE